MPTNSSERDIHVFIRGLCHAHGRQWRLDTINMDIRRGVVTAVVGGRGAGKSCLLDLIGGRLRPDAGHVAVDGQDVHRLNAGGLRALRRDMGMLFPSGALLGDLNVFDNLALPLRVHTSLPAPLVRQLVLLRLEWVGLRGARRLMPAALSPHAARRAGLARAVMLDPSILLCDEPFAGDDPATAAMTGRLLRGLRDELGVTVVVASRDARTALAVADHGYIMDDGEVVARGTSTELQASEAPWTRQFVHGLADGPMPFHYPAPVFDDELAGDQWPRRHG